MTHLLRCCFAMCLIGLACGVGLAKDAKEAPKASPPTTTPPPEYSSPITKFAKDDKGQPKNPIDAGDTAWMLGSTGLVMLMVPGLALFYGGLVRRKNVLGTMMHSMVALGLIGVQWVLVGYSLSFGQSKGGYIGWSSELLGLSGVLSNDTFSATKLSILVHCMYQGMFAIITPALISGAIAERVKFGPYCIFILLWSTLVYDPLAHWVWALNAKGESVGFLGAMGAIDFAGGTVVHVAAGVGGLAAILALRRRIGYPEHAIHPNSVVLSLVGAGLLWFGWFGFNGGSALSSGAQAGAALTATQVAAAAAALAWVVIEWVHRGKPTGLGLATGLVAGLVAVTPASGFVTPMAALIIGACASVACYAAVILKPWLKYDDSLDAFGVHGIGGALGAILTGVFASAALYQASTGLPPDDSTYALSKLGADGSKRVDLIMVQVQAVVIAAVFSFVLTFILVKAIDLTMGFCLDPKAESVGLDRNEHGEVGFDYGGPALDEVLEAGLPEPRAAAVPRVGGKRFTVVVEGSNNGDLAKVWSELCQAGNGKPADFLKVYEHLTTMQGNKFRFKGGDPATLSAGLERIFAERLRGSKLSTRVES